MKTKRSLAALVLVIGAALLIFSMIATRKINEAKGEVKGISGFLPKNAAGSALSGYLEGKASAYDNIVHLSFIGGIILVVIGGGSFFFFRKKKR